jgi:molybdenum cofactor cytidylyltransferase
MNFSQSLRLLPPPSLRETSQKSFGFGGGSQEIAFVGSGGKTTAIFRLARELPLSIIVTATTHLHVDQVRLADIHLIAEKLEDIADLEENLHGLMLVTGSLNGDRFAGINDQIICRLHEICHSRNLPLLIEADGSRQRPLKAPAAHEPLLPKFVKTVVVATALTGLGKSLSEQFVHRPDIFSRLGNLSLNETISPESIVRVLTHPAGGLKNIPAGARRISLLNQADTPELQAQAKGMAEQLLSSFQAVIIASLNPQSTIPNQQNQIHAVYEPVAGIILAAGGSSRFGQPKPMLDWHGKPFVRAVAETALAAGLSPVVVVTGAHAQAVESAIHDLPVTIHHNLDWQSGQSSSIRTGLADQPLPLLTGGRVGLRQVGSAIFLLADQPQVTPTVLRALSEEHAHTLAPIVAPLVQGQRANPVLFDRLTFPDLMSLSGDVGGRAIFSKYPLGYLTWQDESILFDVDTPEEYGRLINGE